MSDLLVPVGDALLAAGHGRHPGPTAVGTQQLYARDHVRRTTEGTGEAVGPERTGEAVGPERTGEAVEPEGIDA